MFKVFPNLENKLKQDLKETGKDWLLENRQH
jgi:hypothetical protein